MPNHLREVVESCDAVLILGAQMGEIASCRRQWPARRMKVVHVDADPTVLGANFLPDVPVLGSVDMVLRLMLAELQQQGIQPNMRKTADGSLHDHTLRAELKAAHE
ncbi:ilvB, partial [Symbiodinium pilosum]